MDAGAPVGAGRNGARDEAATKVLALLRRALDILDRRGAPPEIAARVQQAADAVEEWRPT
jgi:hypothetical protein